MESPTNEKLQETPLYREHVALGAKMAPFGGWLMPIQYAGILAEHVHTRTRVSVFDICHMGEFMIEGDPVACGLDRIVTQKIAALPVGACRYGFMLTEMGGVLDDLIVYRLDEKLWMLVVNAATIAGDEENVRKHLKGEFAFENASARMGKLDVQGPLSRDVLKDIFGVKIAYLSYFSAAEFDLWGEKCIISCTGYTGELGYEIYISSKNVGKLWSLLLNDTRVKPAGLGARDTLRLEMAYPLYGQDLDTSRTPLQAGLERFVDFSKDFIGKPALLGEEQAGVKEHLVCFQAESRRSPRHNSIILADGMRVGTVTSGSFSPTLSVGIGMGYVSRKLALGAKVMVKEAAAEIPAVIVRKPFYRKS